jgi:diacylglycerol kinase (ATP)
MAQTGERTSPLVEPAALLPAWKGRRGIDRLRRAAGHSREGFAAAYRHEAAFRQEVVVGVPVALLGAWLAPTALGALLLVLSVVAVLVVELLNSAIEAVADAVTLEENPLVKRAKDMGSAAVLLALAAAAATWATVLLVR